jgi:hypothetical protein
VVGKNAIGKVEGPEITERSGDGPRGSKPETTMAKSPEGIKCPRITGCSSGRCTFDSAVWRFLGWQICGCVAEDLHCDLGEVVEEILEEELMGNEVGIAADQPMFGQKPRGAVCRR